MSLDLDSGQAANCQRCVGHPRTDCVPIADAHCAAQAGFANPADGCRHTDARHATAGAAADSTAHDVDLSTLPPKHRPTAHPRLQLIVQV